MKILCLYNNKCALKLFAWIEQQNNECVLCNEKIDVEWIKKQKFDLAISYTYGFIVKEDVIDELKGNIVNLHTSYLPWNRGSDPNMWSLIEHTPRGVTLHYINKYLDQGDIIAQEILQENKHSKQTLKSTYKELDNAAVLLFKKAYVFYEFWPMMRKKVIGTGSYHSDKQGRKLREIVPSFDMEVEEFIKKYNILQKG